MNIKNYELSWYIDKIKNNEHFSLGMYGDGEVQCILNSFGDRFKENCEGTLYTKELSKAMAESLKFKAPNFYFSASEDLRSLGYDKKLDQITDIEFVEKDMWHKAMCAGGLYPLIEEFRKHNVCIIGNENLKKLTFLNYDKFIDIGYPNCFEKLEQTKKEILDYGKEGIYVFACGIPATLFVQSVHDQIPNSWFLDLGSIWDGFCGIGGQRPTRRELYKHPETWLEWVDKNLKDIKWNRVLPFVTWYGMGSADINPQIEDRSSEQYWNFRVKSHAKNEERMIWYGQEWKWDSMEMISNHILSMFKDATVLDVGCGYGRYCELFDKDKYLGIDFSEEMIKLARKKYPAYRFEVADHRTYVPEKTDVIFSVMSGNHPRLEEYAKVAFVVISPSETIIKFKNLS
jgi:hypothetical protein